jgi:hypothetical protein
MPGFNRKGPQGEGLMTGRRMGRCNPNNKGKTDDEILQNRDSSVVPEQGIGRGLGFGCGLGIGRGQGGPGRGLGRQNRFRGGN